jgi:RNA recognition motif-containing protein
MSSEQLEMCSKVFISNLDYNFHWTDVKDFMK